MSFKFYPNLFFRSNIFIQILFNFLSKPWQNTLLSKSPLLSPVNHNSQQLIYAASKKLFIFLFIFFIPSTSLTYN